MFYCDPFHESKSHCLGSKRGGVGEGVWTIIHVFLDFYPCSKKKGHFLHKKSWHAKFHWILSDFKNGNECILGPCCMDPFAQSHIMLQNAFEVRKSYNLLKLCDILPNVQKDKIVLDCAIFGRFCKIAPSHKVRWSNFCRIHVDFTDGDHQRG